MSDFILVFLAIILLFSFFRRFIFFFILKAVSERLFNQVKKQQQQQQPYNPTRPEGTVTIDTSASAPKNKKLRDDDGEYVPYEEIK